MKTKFTLNSDCHQFHQYQQNEQSPLISTTITSHLNLIHRTQKLPRYMNKCPDLGQAQKYGRVNVRILTMCNNF